MSVYAAIKNLIYNKIIIIALFLWLCIDGAGM